MNRIDIITDPTERTRFLKFAVVGTIGAVVDFATFNLLTKFLNVNPVIASVISFTVAVISNFTWNRHWTYPDSRTKQLSRQLIEFSIVNVLGVTIRTPVFALLKGPLGTLSAKLPFLNILPFMTPVFWGNNTALAIAVVIVMFWNFFVNRFWTYNDVMGSSQSV
jgi:putative flippase GtrA